jgi:hypothetical protein
MPTTAYKYLFRDTTPADEVEATLVLAILAVEALHGEAQAKMDAAHVFDAGLRTVVIDATTEVGRDFNRLFVGLMSREFGPASFRVERVSRQPEAETVIA